MKITEIDAARFWSKVEKTEYCWNWVGALRSGYGAIKIKQTVFSTHRISWIIANGDIPAGKLICHTCDNKRCVNPDHLFVGTHSDNSHDMVSKGRASRASMKLKDETVREIRRLHEEDGIGSWILSQKFFLSKSNIQNIIFYKTYKHVI